MLRYLSIRNLAVIESVAVEFDAGLNVLTGETGAGKSILVEAVGLLLGGRASSDLVRTGAEVAEIEAQFESEGREIIVRREVTAQGRSRAFVDGALATATALRELAERLIELHGQHEHQVLANPDTHLDLLDDFAGSATDRARVSEQFAIVQQIATALRALELDERQQAARVDLLTFQRTEIERANPQAGEDADLAAAKLVLSNAERLQRLSGDAYAALYESDEAAMTGLNGVWKRVAELATLDQRVVPYLESRETITSQLEDLAFFLRGYADDIDASPGRLQEVEDRLAVLERLKKKYGPSLDDVLRHREACTGELDSLERIDERTAELKARLDDARQSYLEAARALSSRRRDAASHFAKALEGVLAELAMSRTRFNVRFNETEPAEGEWTDRGIDTAEFVVSPNPGEELRPLARIASGGELSRIMLALRSLSAGTSRRGTLIFDEVDAGIGGRAADDVGRKLQRLGRGTQVLCITHLPQIAACGGTHFQVNKRVTGGRTVTSVTRLTGAAREEELARMMAGGTLSKGVLASAAELLSSRQAKGESKAKGESETRALSVDASTRRAGARPAPPRDRK